MKITYKELRKWLDDMTPKQLSMPVMVYAGDIDDAMLVFGVCTNSKDEMGQSLDGLEKTQPLMLI
jgi:hypothetical protein